MPVCASIGEDAIAFDVEPAHEGVDETFGCL